MERLFLQIIKKKLTILDKFPPLNYDKTLNPPFLSPPTKISEKIHPIKMPCLTSWFPPLYKGEVVGRKETMEILLASLGNVDDYVAHI